MYSNNKSMFIVYIIIIIDAISNYLTLNNIETFINPIWFCINLGALAVFSAIALLGLIAVYLIGLNENDRVDFVKEYGTKSLSKFVWVLPLCLLIVYDVQMHLYESAVILTPIMLIYNAFVNEHRLAIKEHFIRMAKMGTTQLNEQED